MNNKKIPLIKLLIEKHNPDLVMFNEFGKSEEIKCFPKFPGFSPVSYHLKGSFSGVCTYVKLSLLPQVTLVETKHDMTMAQIAAVKISDFTIYNVYRSPSMEKTMNKHEIEKFVNFIDGIRDYNAVLVGDLNLHVEWDTYESTNVNHRKIAQALLEKGMVQYQHSKTYPLNGDSTPRTLDVSLSNNLSIVTSCFTDDQFDPLDTGIDHVPTLTQLSLDVVKVVKKTIQLRKKRDKPRFFNMISSVDWELMFNLIGKNVDALNQFITNVFLQAEKDTTPTAEINPDKIRSTGHQECSQRTKKLIKAKSDLSKASKVKRKTKKYKSKKMKLTKAILKSLRQDRYKWQMRTVNRLEKNSNEVWNVIKGSTVQSSTAGGIKKPSGELTFIPSEKTNLLSDRYKSVLTPKTYHTCNPDDPLGSKIQPGLDHVTITELDVEAALKRSNNSQAKDSVGLSMPLFRETAVVISWYLAMMFAICMESSSLAVPWLMAMILPIPKKGDMTEPKSWRPVSLEHTILRIYEAALNYEIVKYLDSISFFHNQQNGFRKRRSCLHNLLDYWCFVVTKVEQYGSLDTIYADTSSAFDRLSHGILLDKLYFECGIYGVLWKQIQAWTSNRTQFVFWNGCKSKTEEVTSSCLQGSCLGTTCWNIYFNSICEKLDQWIEELGITNCSFWMYADDLKLSFVPTKKNVKKINVLLKRLQAEMDKLKLQFNPDKCAVLGFGNSNPKRKVFMRNQDGDVIELKRSSSERDLGLLIDSDGTFTSAISRGIKVATATMKILRKTFEVTTFRTKVMLYHSHIFSRMAYCSELWRPVERTVMDKMNRIYVEFFKFTKVPKNKNPPFLPEQLMLLKDLKILWEIYHEQTPLDSTQYFDDKKRESLGEKPKTRFQANRKLKPRKWNRWSKTLLISKNADHWHSIPEAIRLSNDKQTFLIYVKEIVLPKLACNQFRVDMINGDMRRRALRELSYIKKARKIQEMNIAAGIESTSRPSDFMVDEDFDDDFLQPNLCLKKMKKRNLEIIQYLAKHAPHMNLCMCPSEICEQEVLEFEQKNGVELRQLPQVHVKQDFVLNKQANGRVTVDKDADVFYA